ncbi:hypothetical protein JL09_g6839, partial [Pichia kudriavzevii]
MRVLNWLLVLNAHVACGLEFNGRPASDGSIGIKEYVSFV